MMNYYDYLYGLPIQYDIDEIDRILLTSLGTYRGSIASSALFTNTASASSSGTAKRAGRSFYSRIGSAKQ